MAFSAFTIITRFWLPALRAVSNSLATWLARRPRTLLDASKTRVLASAKYPHPLSIWVLVHQFTDREDTSACCFNFRAGTDTNTVGGDARLTGHIATTEKLPGTRTTSSSAAYRLRRLRFGSAQLLRLFSSLRATSRHSAEPVDLLWSLRSPIRAIRAWLVVLMFFLI